MAYYRTGAYRRTVKRYRGGARRKYVRRAYGRRTYGARRTFSGKNTTIYIENKPYNNSTQTKEPPSVSQTHVPPLDAPMPYEQATLLRGVGGGGLAQMEEDTPRHAARAAGEAAGAAAEAAGLPPGTSRIMRTITEERVERALGGDRDSFRTPQQRQSTLASAVLRGGLVGPRAQHMALPAARGEEGEERGRGAKRALFNEDEN